MTPDELRAKLGMKPGQLLTNKAGDSADILGVDEEKGIVILGILSKPHPIEVPLSNILPKNPEGI